MAFSKLKFLPQLDPYCIPPYRYFIRAPILENDLSLKGLTKLLNAHHFWRLSKLILFESD